MAEAGSLRAVIELEKSSGKFELDPDGWTRFIPSDDKLAQLNRWIGEEMDRAMTDMAPMFAAAAENIETYRPARLMITDTSERAVSPSPIARTPADQVIANTVNGVLRYRPIFSFDPFFAAKYPVLIPVPVSALRERGLPVDPTTPDDATVGISYEVDAERMSRRFEQGVDFQMRERLDFPFVLHKAVYLAVAGAPPYIKAWYEPKPRTYIGIKEQASAFVDTQQTEERYTEKGCVHLAVVPFQNVLRPNIDDDMDALDWYAERRANDFKPDALMERFYNGELFLIDDKEAAAGLAANTIDSPKDESEQRTDSTTRRYDPTAPYRGYCDVWEVPFKAYLKIVDPDDPEAKPKTRRFSLVGYYHYGARKFMSIRRNPYNHQRAWMEPIQQFIDGCSTVEVLKPAQQLQSHLVHYEMKGALAATTPVIGYEPTSSLVASFIQGLEGKPLPYPLIIPGMPVKDWDFKRGGFEHHSLLQLMQWNAGTSQEASRVSDYDAGNRVVSHTSPSTVAQMLERGGQPQVLFLRLLDRSLRKIVRLCLEMWRQFEPLGEDIPIMDPVEKKIVNAPFYYPIGDVLDNFQCTTTAASEAIASERDPDKQERDLAMYREHTTYAAQIAAAIVDPKMTVIEPKVATALIDQFTRNMQGEQALFDRIIGPIRTDEEKFDQAGPIETLAEMQKQAIAEAVERQRMEQMNAANNPAAAGGNLQPAPQGSNPAGLVGSGAESGMDGGTANPSPEGASPVIPGG